MKQMTIERSLEVKGILAAEQVRLQCQMKYQNEDDGKRAVGNIYVRGIYFDGEKKRPLREIVVLDVFAPNYKLIDDEVFSVEVKDSHYDILNQTILLSIDLLVHGICDDDEPVEMVPLEMDVKTDEANLYYEYDQQPIEIVEEQKDEIREDVQNEMENSCIEEDMFYQKEERTNFRMIILKENCSYEMLAARYSVDIHRLRKLNGDKTLLSGTLVVLP
ncbi:MAG: hypothetical protein IJO78_04300 [Erysipelotrichaceae bacterium]|nr:hypothetical protein [Erysipelotrichaceae bacterium]